MIDCESTCFGSQPKPALANIVLIGMMGCGKTTIGELISQKSGMAFVDTDALIENKEKVSISDIFEHLGETYFREREAEAAQTAAKYTNLVIATGGGMVLNPKSMDLLSEYGFVVYLECEALLLHQRLSGISNRPLLYKLDELLEQRKVLYEKYSNFTADGEIEPDKLAEMILHEYNCNYKRA